MTEYNPWIIARQLNEAEAENQRVADQNRALSRNAEKILAGTPLDTTGPTIMESKRRGASWLARRSQQRSNTILGGFDYAQALPSIPEIDPDRLWGFKTLGGR